METVVLVGGGVLLGLAALVILLSALAPTRLAYTEEITIAAPVRDVYDDIRLQDHLMRWSAWPGATGSTCAVDATGAVAGQDGQVGARTVFFSKGRRIGHQEIVALDPDRSVSFTLEGAGPPHSPRLTFRLHPRGPGETRVVLDFENRFPRPFNAIWHFAGLSRWTRRMHRRDLDGLKAFSEPPHRDADGRVVGRPPHLPNPYAVAMPTAA